MKKSISIIIPNYNKSSTIGKCLEAAFASNYSNFEVIVVDDCSTDNSIGIIRQFPCKLIQLQRHSGASKARNVGAQNSSSEIFFFIDADCLLQKNTLALVNNVFIKYGSAVIGGTYTRLPYDDVFFSTFQSIYVNYFETKKEEPDYIAAHAMIIDSDIFNKSGGFYGGFLPIIEDVEFSHRLRRAGYRLLMNPDIQVQHIFNFTLIRSLKNAFRKSLYWTIYSMKNRDLLKDSGAASAELKLNVASCFLTALLVIVFFIFKNAALLILIPFVIIFNLFVSRRFLKAIADAKGLSFAVTAALYYTMPYPLAVGAGALAGMAGYFMGFKPKRYTDDVFAS
ncbi:MAG: glycosyltransferase family 2 protein [Nitrospirae bacterium]|nr:glycosyltransferase family 2 protein [Nitrospirota bacterium]